MTQIERFAVKHSTELESGHLLMWDLEAKQEGRVNSCLKKGHVCPFMLNNIKKLNKSDSERLKQRL